MRKNNQYSPYNQEEREALWRKINDHAKTKPDLDIDNISTWSKEDFRAYRKWSREQHEMKRLFDFH